MQQIFRRGAISAGPGNGNGCESAMHHGKTTCSQTVTDFQKPRGEFTIVIQGTGNVKKSLRKAREKSK